MIQFFPINNFPLSAVRILTLGSALWLVTVGAAAQPTEDNPAGSGRMDEAITGAIRQNLILDRRVRPDEINVETHDGSVTLRGTVDDLLAKQTAERIARSVAGVRDINDQLTVRPVGWTDARIQKEVWRALANDSRVDVFDIQVGVHHGVVSLYGTVPSWAERHCAAQTAVGVGGVRGLKNGLTVSEGVAPSDSQLATAIRQKLTRDYQLGSANLTVTVQHEKAHLAGQVADIHQKNRAIQDAWTAGARAVDAGNVQFPPPGVHLVQASVGTGGNSVSISSGGSSNAAFTDGDISQTVRQWLRGDPLLQGSFITVDITNHGVVTLSGTVPTLLARERAVDLANAVRGVTGIYDNLTLQPTSRSDSEIQQEVVRDLETNPVTQGRNIDVNVHNGLVTLTGQVHSWEQFERAEDVAKSIPGVTKVQDDRLAVQQVADRSDSAIANDVRSSLKRDARLAHSPVEVQVENGHVILRGNVGSDLEKKSAIADARVMNARSVDAEQLAIIPSPLARRWPGVSAPSDQEIQKAILALFQEQPWLFPSNGRVQVQQGVVTLSGTVDNAKAKWLAAQEARQVAGVKGVQNEIKFRVPALSPDQQLAASVDRVIRTDPYVAGRNISVRADDGIVTLNGQVDSTSERLEAERVASQVQGVRSVNNHLQVASYTGAYDKWPFWDLNPQSGVAEYQPGSSVNDRQLQARIRTALASEPLLQDNPIQVRVVNGEATLSGNVDSLRERREASLIARNTGALRVINQLEVGNMPLSSR